MNLQPALKRFSRRVRLLSGWLGLGMGLTVGAALAAIWAALDWFNVLYAEWASLGWLVAACGVLGLIIGLFRRITPKALADSIDRRAGLQNRLGTASERSETHGAFDDALREDANGRLESLKPASLYPIRVSRWHAGAVALSIVAASVFLLGNTPLLLSETAKKNREELQKKSAEVERVMKPLEDEAKQGSLNPDEKKLAEELKKLSQDLHKARIDPAEAMRKQNELEKEAKKLSDNRFDKSDQDFKTAQSMADQMKQAELEKLEAQLQQSDFSKPGDPTTGQNQNSKLSPEEMQQLQKANDLQQQIASIQEQLKDKSLSKAAKDALKDKLSELQKKLANMHLSKNVQDMLDRMMKDPLWKQIQELMNKLAQAKAAAAKSGQQGGKGGQLTQEQIDQMMKYMEALAEQLKDPKAMHAYLQALLDALKNAKLGQCMSPIGLFGPPMPGAGPPTRDLYFANTGKIFTGKGEKSRGLTEAVGVTGQSREVPGQDSYIELRGPSTNGLRSSIPYQKVLPSYKHKADEAINRQEIPPEQQERVKKYFESLGH